MLDWIKNINKNYPEFWKKYLESFEQKPSRIIAMSIEATGTNPDEDLILSIGAIALKNEKLVINDSFEVNILQYIEDQEGYTNNFTIESKLPKILQPEAITGFIEFLSNSVIVGHRINFEINILNVALDKLGCGKLKNEFFDIEAMYRKYKEITDDRQISLEELAEEFKIPKSDRISSIEDAYSIALIFLKLKNRLGIQGF